MGSSVLPIQANTFTEGKYPSFINRLLVALSAGDSNKWQRLVEYAKKAQICTLYQQECLTNYEQGRVSRQKQKRLSLVEMDQMIVRYREGETIYDLSAEFGIHRDTVAKRLKKAGVKMRRSTPKRTDINAMVRLYSSGLSLARVALETGFSANTVPAYLRSADVQVRDCQGRER